MYLNINGIPSDSPPGDGQLYFWFDPQGIWRRSIGDRSADFDTLCVRLHDKLRAKIMTGVDYNTLVYGLPTFVMTAGLSAEAPIGSRLFESLLAKAKDFPELNRFLYLYDCQKLVASLQECMKEIVQLLGEFYKTLSTEPLFYPPLPPPSPDDVRYNASPVVTKLFAYLSFIFIRMHSMLDYTVKIATEVDHLAAGFASYPKLRSLNVQFGDRKKISINHAPGTVLEDCELITTIETLRNHLIHDGLLDDMPKAYERIEAGRTVERFILMPDMTHGRFDRFKNRNLFFGAEDKINLRLPAVIAEFEQRMEATVSLILRRWPP